MIKKIGIAIITICVMGFCLDFAHASYLGNTQISFERAIEIAFGRAGGNGTVKEVEWNLKYGQPIYEVEIYRNGQKYEIKINGVTGEVFRLKSKQTYKIPAGLTVSQITSARSNEFAKIAVDMLGGGTVVNIEWEQKTFGTIVDVKIINNGVKHEVKINPVTSEIVQHKQKSKAKYY